MVINVLAHRQGCQRSEVECNHWASLLQQHLSAKRQLMLTDSWALTPRAVCWTERLSVKQEQQYSLRKFWYPYLIFPSNFHSLVLILLFFFSWTTSGNPPKWKTNLPKEYGQSAPLVIIASYPLLKKINTLARNIVVRLCCTLIWQVCVIKSIENRGAQWKKNKKKTFHMKV